MRRVVRSFILAVIAICSAARAADDTRSRSDATVLVYVTSMGSELLGNGFVFGDGSLVVTARHVLLGNSRPGAGESIGIVTLLSPYLGDACEARIIEEDPELDVAVLECPWKGHPALKIAAPADVVGAAEVELLSRVDLISALFADDLDGVDACSSKTATEKLPVDFIGVRGGEARIASLGEASKLRPGWSGGPLFLSGTDQLVGGLSTLSGTGPIVGAGADHASAFLMPRVVALLTAGGRAGSLQRVNTIEHPADADAVFRLLLEERVLTAQHHVEEARSRLKKVMEARHASALYLSWDAAAAWKMNKPTDAESTLKKALALDPRSICARTMFAQLLAEQKRWDESVALLEDLRKTEPKNSVGTVTLCNVLTLQGKYAEVAELALKASQSWPRDGKLWTLLGQAQQKLGDPAAAIVSLRHAAELEDRSPMIRMLFAMVLEQGNELDQAESQYRSLTQMSPADARAHFLLGNFLARHRPQLLAEAAKEVEAAIALPEPEGGPSREAMRARLLQIPDPRAATRPDAP